MSDPKQTFSEKEAYSLMKKNQELMAQVKALEKLAYYDELTGLHNNVYLNRILKPLLEDKSFWLSYVDINDLKKANDLSPDAHSKGNELIKMVSKTISQFGTSIRIHGDEFLVILKTKKDKEDFEETSEKNKKHYAYGIVKKEKEQNFDNVVLEADILMYKNKLEYKKSQNENNTQNENETPMCTAAQHILERILEVYPSLKSESILQNDFLTPQENIKTDPPIQ